MPRTPVAGPGQRYQLAPTAPTGRAGPGEPIGVLPTAYGTERLRLTARDPHWLYAHWDLTHEQQLHYNSLAAEQHLVLRIYAGEITGAPLKEVHLHPDSRHWFVHVDQANARYVAQLGYYQPGGRWLLISTSPAAATPPDTLSGDTSVRFATLPFDVPLETLVQEVKAAVREPGPLLEAVQQLHLAGRADLTPSVKVSPAAWTPAEEQALAAVVSLEVVPQASAGSLEVVEMVRQHAERNAALPQALPSDASSSWSGGSGAVTSPLGRPAPAAGNEFWFNVNVELIVYGATEPDAQVSVGGRAVALRPDGTFSLRFALPDGQYELLAMAASARGPDHRQAQLRLGRRTEYHGHVGAHPPDPQATALPPR